jgi:hypothetical protein
MTLQLNTNIHLLGSVSRKVSICGYRRKTKAEDVATIWILPSCHSGQLKLCEEHVCSNTLANCIVVADITVVCAGLKEDEVAARFKTCVLRRYPIRISAELSTFFWDKCWQPSLKMATASSFQICTYS